MLGLRFSKERTKKLATGDNSITWNLVIVNPAYRGLDINSRMMRWEVQWHASENFIQSFGGII